MHFNQNDSAIKFLKRLTGKSRDIQLLMGPSQFRENHPAVNLSWTTPALLEKCSLRRRDYKHVSGASTVPTAKHRLWNFNLFPR